jgi:RHS repeat-associated protein
MSKQKHMGKLLFVLIYLFIYSSASAFTIGAILPGSQTVFTGSTGATISLSGPDVVGYSYQWTFSTNGSDFYPLPGATSISYTPVSTSPFQYYQVIMTSHTGGANGVSPIATVTIRSHLASGAVTPATATIGYNTSPGLLTSSGATGGIGTYAYQWQSSADNTTFSDISGATAQNYTPGNQSVNIYFRQKTICGSETVYSGSMAVTVTVQPGTVSPSTQANNYGGTATILTAAVAAGGNGSYTYLWQSSPDNSTWTNISAATSSSYTPGAVTGTRYYRLMTTSGSQNVAGNAATVVFYPQVTTSITPASITINYSTSPGLLTNTRAGGNSTYTYQWQSSPNNSTWTNISGATAQNYTPGNLTATTYYHVITTSNGVAITSNTTTATVYPQIVAGTITPSSANIYFATSPGLLTGSAPSGGNGGYTYQWQSSTDGTTWNAIIGATAQYYTPLELTVNTRFRRAVTSNGVTVYTSPAVFTVYPVLQLGNMYPDTLLVNFYGAFSYTSYPATGGNGAYTYQWQSSTNGTTWTDISGENTLSYMPVGLTANMYYRLKVTSVTFTAYSNTLLAVRPLNGGLISVNTATVSSGGSVTLSSVQNAFGGYGCGSYTYQWQSSLDGYNWANIAGTSVTGITKTNWFRRLVYCGVNTVASNTVRVKVTGAAGFTPDTTTGAAAGSQTLAAMPAYPAGINPNNMNYVRTRTFTKPGITDQTTADAQTGVNDVKQVTTYIDGLGRTIQTVVKQATPDLADMISTNFYDPYGREAKQYMPYSDGGSSGNFRTDVATKQAAFYNTQFGNRESYYYQNTIYEQSPLNRVLETTTPGKSWTGQATGISQLDRTNTQYDSVIIWNMDIDSAAVPFQGGYYVPGTLYLHETTDEQDNRTVEYKDLEGHTILKKVQLSDLLSPGYTGWLSTYYVYDDLDRLRFVIPPKAVEAIKSNWVVTTIIATELCFQYRYDQRNRMIVKKLPGADSTEMVYDKRDRLIATWDGNLKYRQFWRVMYYDTQNRERMSGLLNSALTRAQMQANVNANAFNPTNSFPFITESTVIPLVNTYYDDYTYSGSQAYATTDIAKPQALSNPYKEDIPAAASKLTRGMVTGKKAQVDYTGQFLMTTLFYNDKGRVVQTIADNTPGGKDITNSLYDFSGKLLSTYLRHTNPRSTVTPQTTLLTMYHFDAGGRQDSVKKRLNDNTALQQTLAVNDYDELGQLNSKRLNAVTSSQLESLNYEYNIRGWLKSVNKAFINTAGSTSNWFGQELSYDYGFGNKELNGNISGAKWKSRSDGIARAFGYDYDNLNRLTQASFNQQNSGSTTWSQNLVNFSVSGLSYDANGNILSMKQQGLNGPLIQTIDSLKYGYNTTSNRLSFVTDKRNDAASKLGDFKEINNNETQDYWYDLSGNVSMDKNKNIDSIFYNHLNLVSIVYVHGKGQIYYQYKGTGEKVTKIVIDTSFTPGKVTTTHYVNELVYEQDTLQYISHEEGRIRPVYKSGQPVSFVYDYFVKDHLGNVRMVLGTQTDTAQYVATMETAVSGVENALFSNIDNTRTAKPSGYPTDNTTNPNAFVAKLNASNGQKIGPSLVLRVMAGDSITIAVKALYKNAGASTPYTTSSSMVTSILQAFSGGGIADGVHTGTGTTAPVSTFTSGLYDGLKSKDPLQNVSTKPKAYLNYALFDDQFNLVDENSGVLQVQGPIDSLVALVLNKTPIKKTGFLYIYTSNESAQDVFFDNLIVTHDTGPLLEETHYYPFGLTMAGISSKVLKGSLYPENKKKYNGIEFTDELDLNLYEAQLRSLDPQIGKWYQIDPKIENMEMWSPYVSNYDNPIRYNDFLGDSGISPISVRETDGDQTGLIINSTQEYWDQNPISAAERDFSHFVLDALGINAIDNFVTNRFESRNNGVGQIAMELAVVGLATTRGEGAAKPKATLLDGSFSLTEAGFKNYPTAGNVPKPNDPLRMVENPEYAEALRLKNNANRNIHNANPDLKGQQIHEVHPVKFGGSPTDPANKIPLAPEVHKQYTAWWNSKMWEIMKELKK